MWRLRTRALDDGSTPIIMGVLNCTPDSFSDGGQFLDPKLAAQHALRMVNDGAHIIDIGAESTRPGAAPVEADEQVRRAIPVIRAIRSASDVAISIDTTSSAVAQQAIQAGAEAINDVSGGHDDPHMLDVAARARCGLIVMHRARKPTQDSYSDRYRGDEPMSGDVVASVAASLRAALERCDRAGVKRECVAIDPGVGFGKTVEQNMQLIARAHEFVSLGRPLVSGLSRKSFVGRVALGRDSTPDERLSGTIAISVMHMLSGASIFRVHDVAPVAQALRAARAVRAHGP